MKPITIIILCVALTSCSSERIIPNKMRHLYEFTESDRAIVCEDERVIKENFNGKISSDGYWYSENVYYASLFTLQLTEDELNLVYKDVGDVPYELRQTMHLPVTDLNYVGYKKLVIGDRVLHILPSRVSKQAIIIVKQNCPPNK